MDWVKRILLFGMTAVVAAAFLFAGRASQQTGEQQPAGQMPALGPPDATTTIDDRDYKLPFKFTGKLNRLTIALDRPKLKEADGKWLIEASQRASDGR